MEETGEVRLATFSQALSELPSGGLAYLPSSSYREMEEWTLPPEAYHRLEALKEALGEERISQGESPLIRGSHWRNYLVKYSESNRMHKKALALSKLCRERGDPKEARMALGAAQCNDVYWHGVFGGLYLRHLRDTVWRKLAEAEGFLRIGEGLAWEQVDLDLDGHEEIWIHSERFSALVSPVRGGAVEEFTLFQAGINLANTLTRRREAYHQRTLETPAGAGEDPHPDGGGDQTIAPSIHDLEGGLRFMELPPVDAEDRALFQERVLGSEIEIDAYQGGHYKPLRSWAGQSLRVVAVDEGPAASSGGPEDQGPAWVEISLGDLDEGRFEKRMRFSADGTLDVLYSWDPLGFPEDALFTTELSLGAEIEVMSVPNSDFWRFPVSTFSKSERGFDEMIQGESVTIRWPVGIGWGRIRLTEK
jgi:alpha-amylase